MSLPRPENSATPSRRLRVLYAEDVKELREVARMILTVMGHTMESAEDGQQALDRVNRGLDDFDVIITDHHMPTMNGLEFVHELRALSYRGKILVFSSDLDPGTAVLYRLLKVDGIFNKPVPPKLVREILAELFPPDAPRP